MQQEDVVLWFANELSNISILTPETASEDV
jgi:hypothetical protein